MLAWKGCTGLHISAFQLRHQRYVYHFEDIPWLMRLATSNGLSIHRGFIEGGNCNMVFLVFRKDPFGHPCPAVETGVPGIVSRDISHPRCRYDVHGARGYQVEWGHFLFWEGSSNEATSGCSRVAEAQRLLLYATRNFSNKIRRVDHQENGNKVCVSAILYLCQDTQLQRYDSVANLLTNGSAASESVSPILTNPLCSCLSVVSPQVNHMAHWPILQGNLSQV